MDPLSITAGVIAIIQIADRIISVCKDYITAVKDAPNDLRTILIEVGSVKSLLEVTELLILKRTHGNNSVLESSEGPLRGCEEALKALEKMFPMQVDRSATGKRRKVVVSLTNLAWPFKEGKARKLLEDIGRHKATLSLALTTETA
jgi:hypothetical protein